MPKWDDVVDPIFDVVFHNEANCGKKIRKICKNCGKKSAFLDVVDEIHSFKAR